LNKNIGGYLKLIVANPLRPDYCDNANNFIGSPPAKNSRLNVQKKNE